MPTTAPKRRAAVVPLGYRLPTEPRKTVPVLDEPTDNFIYGAFALVADGRRSLRRIAEILAEDGFQTPAGKPYPVAKLRSILHNPFYAGRVWRDGKLVRGSHERIIDMYIFNYVQQQLGPDERPEPMYR